MKDKPSVAVLPLAMRNKLPFVNGNQANELGDAQNAPYSFSTVAEPSAQGHFMAEQMKSEGFDTIGLLIPNNAVGDANEASYGAAFEEAGLVMEVERFEIEDIDMAAPISRLDDKDVDAVIVATPDHWHALPTVLACQAGKDVYVEKPLATSVREGRAMITAAREHQRVVQMGTQWRSGRHFAEAVEVVRSGKLGKVSLTRGWAYHDWLPACPKKPDGPVPEGVDYDRSQEQLGPVDRAVVEGRRVLLDAIKAHQTEGTALGRDLDMPGVYAEHRPPEAVKDAAEAA